MNTSLSNLLGSVRRRPRPRMSLLAGFPMSWVELRWIVLALLGVLGLSLGLAGWITLLHAHTFSALLDAGYRTVALLRLSGSLSGPIPWTLQVARFLLPLVAGWSAIAALRRVYRDRIRLLTLPTRRGQVIVVGLGDKGLSFVRSFRRQHDTVVVIEINPLAAGLRAARELGAVVVIGDGQDPEVLTSAGLLRARMLVAVTGDDGTNADVLLESGRIPARSATPPPERYAHVSDWHLAELLGLDELRHSTGSAGIFEFFSTDDLSAQAIIDKFWWSDDHGARNPLILLGFSSLTQRTLIEAAARTAAVGRAPIDCFVIDRSGRDCWNALVLRHPMVTSQVFPTFFDDLGGAVSSLAALPADAHPLAVVDVQQDGRSISEAILLSELRAGPPPVIVVAVRRSSGLSTAINRHRPDAAHDIEAFPVINSTCTERITHTALVECIARDIHEQYVRDRRAAGITDDDPAMAPWSALAEDLKISNRSQAGDLGKKLAAIGCSMSPQLEGETTEFHFTPAEIEQLAELEHERWCAERIRGGWTYAESPRDLAARRSPYLLSWSQLSEQVKDLDRNTVRTIPAQCARAHATIRRMSGTQPR